IGIVTSFFTAVYLTRIIVERMVSRANGTISLNTPLSKLWSQRKEFDFVSKRRPAMIFSAIVIVVGLAVTLLQGVTLGVDFKGGRSYIVAFGQPVSATDLKVDLAESFDNQGLEVKNYGSNNVMRVTTSYLIDDESEEADQHVREALISGVERLFPNVKYTDNPTAVDETHFAITGSSKVGATVAEDIKNSAWKASLLSLAGIFIYILGRFRKWQFSAGAIIALIHDALFVFAAYSIAGALGLTFEIDQVFVAAILTIIGYSINDTVIIFDRIRENIGLGTSHNRRQIFNSALNTTLSRTLITSGSTLLVVLVLFLFGGEVLRGFAFALLVGVAIGTYSSLFIAAPIVLDLDPEEKGKTVTAKRAVAARG